MGAWLAIVIVLLSNDKVMIFNGPPQFESKDECEHVMNNPKNDQGIYNLIRIIADHLPEGITIEEFGVHCTREQRAGD